MGTHSLFHCSFFSSLQVPKHALAPVLLVWMSPVSYSVLKGCFCLSWTAIHRTAQTCGEWLPSCNSGLRLFLLMRKVINEKENSCISLINSDLFAFATMYLNLSCILLPGPFDSFLWNTQMQFTWISLVADNLHQIWWNCLGGLYRSLQNWRMVATL